jgi:hypothetical protein
MTGPPYPACKKDAVSPTGSANDKVVATRNSERAKIGDFIDFIRQIFFPGVLSAIIQKAAQLAMRGSLPKLTVQSVLGN